MGVTFASGLLSAEQAFHCYSFTSVAPQVFEYNSNNCGGLESRKLVGSIGKDAENENGDDVEKPVLCLIQAGCKPVDVADAKKEPPQKSDAELTILFQDKFLKPSLLACKGWARVDRQHKVLTSAHCPPPSECRADVFYNYTTGPVATVTDKVSIPANAKGVVR